MRACRRSENIAAGTHHLGKLATESGNRTVGQVNLSPVRAAVPTVDVWMHPTHASRSWGVSRLFVALVTSGRSLYGLSTRVVYAGRYTSDQ